MTAPRHPAGEFATVNNYDKDVRSQLTDELRKAPLRLEAVVTQLSDEPLDSRYRNWDSASDRASRRGQSSEQLYPLQVDVG